MPEERLTARFDDAATLELTPDLVGPSITRNEGIIGEGVDLNLIPTRGLRKSTLLFHLTKRLLETKWRDPGEEPKLHLFGQLKRITRETQPAGRVRFWGDVTPGCENGPRVLRVVTLDDDETIHNMFFDRGYRRDAS